MGKKKLGLLGVIAASSAPAHAHPGHGTSLLEDLFHTMTSADHFPITMIAVIALVTGLLIWQSRR
ncbi:hypothetical protein [Zwartia panacis]|uniref:hypothetical protein n=1 Tax=Zwartia panacis TaxID=2683345 RepID=UPI0025B2C788|nr:hypothetical protein [Zwartia panacis]MDN4017814.1 hypothetical protein [Zwartia panacis]